MENVDKFRKKPKNNKHRDEPANIWLRDYLKNYNSPGYKHKGKSNFEFAQNCNMTKEALEGKASGRYPIYANDIIAFVKETGISADEILGIERKEVPDNLKVVTNRKVGNIETNILSQEVCDKLSKHILKDGLFPAQDEYLKFLEYLILEEDYVKNLLNKSKQSFATFVKDIENNEIPDKVINLLFNNKDFDSFVNTIKNNNELNERFKGTITDTKIRNDIRDFIYKYIYDNLKK